MKPWKVLKLIKEPIWSIAKIFIVLPFFDSKFKSLQMTWLLAYNLCNLMV